MTLSASVRLRTANNCVILSREMASIICEVTLSGGISLRTTNRCVILSENGSYYLWNDSFGGCLIEDRKYSQLSL